MQTSGQQLRTALKSAKLTQKQLATQYGIPLRTVEDWCTDRRTPGYVLNLLLRCIAMDFPTEQPLSEQEPTQKKPYKLYNLQGKPLTSVESDFVHQERAEGRVDKLILSEDDDPYHTRQVYYCTTNDFKFEVVKEV